MRIFFISILILLLCLLSLTSSWRLQQNLLRRQIPKLPSRSVLLKDGGKESSVQEPQKPQSSVAEDKHERLEGSEQLGTETTATQSNTTTPIDPKEVAKKELEVKLQADLSKLEDTLRTKRLSLNRAKNRLAESGPRGYYLVQAQVNEYLRNKAADEAKVIAKNKREFVLKVLPIIDKFRSVPSELPGETKEENAIHENYKFIRVGLELAVKKYGYEEFTPVQGDKLESHYHQVIGLEEGEKDGIVVRCDKSGWKFSENNDVIRKASVIVTKAKPAPEPPKEENSDNNAVKSEENKQNETATHEEQTEPHQEEKAPIEDLPQSDESSQQS